MMSFFPCLPLKWSLALTFSLRSTLFPLDLRVHFVPSNEGADEFDEPCGAVSRRVFSMIEAQVAWTSCCRKSSLCCFMPFVHLQIFGLCIGLRSRGKIEMSGDGGGLECLALAAAWCSRRSLGSFTVGR